MTKRKTAKPDRDSAGAAFERYRTEALHRLRLITEVVTKAGRGVEVNWSEAGSMGRVSKLLGEVGHYAGVAELTEI